MTHDKDEVFGSEDEIVGSEFIYKIDTSYGLSADGYIATGTESIVYKGIKISKDSNIRLSCVLKFKYKSIKMGDDAGTYKIMDVLERFKNNDLKIFDELQNCRSVVRIFDVIENLGKFCLIDTHVREGKPSISITCKEFFCVVEEYIDGWSLEEYCRDEYWKLTESVDVGHNLKKKKSFHEFSEERKNDILKSYHHDYDEIIRYQSEIFSFMLNLCEILQYITDEKKILHLDLKPDNIMVTRHGREIVLIDFGRSEHISADIKAVKSPLGEADYNNKERIARMFQYGTLGYAAPECYVQPMNGSNFPFDDNGIQKGIMSIESDIFSFGATFWECLNMFELYTGSKVFAKDKGLGGSYDFYKTYLLNDDAYFDRDLSLTSPHYHERLEAIIKKCTRKRTAGYRESPLFYHKYEDLKKDIEYARDSAPALVKTENIKVRNSFGVAGVMAGLLIVVILVCILLKITGSYFAQRKMDNIISNYNPTKIEWLENAALDQMRSSTEGEKHDIYDKVYKFLREEDNGLEYAETVVLVELLKQMNESDFIGDSIDTMLINVDKKGFSSCIEYTVTNLTDNNSLGYTLAVQIYNAQKRVNLDECYTVLKEYSDSSEYCVLIQRLALDLNHDEMISQIAQYEMSKDPDSDKYSSNEFNIKMAELKNDIKRVLESVEN